MTTQSKPPLALVVRQAPYAQREPRAQLDVALAAAALELPLEIYFIGNGIRQLAGNHEPETAALPPGLKGWAAITDMTSARFFAEPDRVHHMENLRLKTTVRLESLDRAGMSRRWRNCSRMMAL